jgi:hypothetical protein
MRLTLATGWAFLLSRNAAGNKKPGLIFPGTNVRRSTGVFLIADFFQPFHSLAVE